MADFSYRTEADTLCSGYSGESIGSSGPSGSANAGQHSFTTEHWWQNGGWGATTVQNMKFVIRHDINISYDKNNLMTVRADTTISSLVASSAANSSVRQEYEVVVRPYEGGPEGYRTRYNYWQTGTFVVNRHIGTWTSGKIWPGNWTGQNDFYFCNWSIYAGTSEASGCSQYMDKITAGLRFKNDRPLLYDTPTVNSTTCAADRTGLKLSATVDFGDIRPGSGNKVEFEVSKNQDFSLVAWSGSKTGNNDRTQILSTNMTGLQPNTKYYVRYRASNGAKTSGWSQCEAVTMTTNTLSEPYSDYWSEGHVRLAVQMGDNYYKDPTTDIYYRKCEGGDWQKFGETRHTKTVANITITDLEAETCYEVQARTTTPAGTYTGNTVQFTTPEKNRCTANYTEIEPTIDEELQTKAKICYHYKTSAVPADIWVYYRVKGSFDNTWILAEEKHTVNDLEGDYCFTLEGLFPNQTVYETYIHTECEGNPWDSPISEFITPLLPLPDNCNCDNFNYLADLICQAIKSLEKGNKTIYANQATKDLCDPYSENPTLATLWSRLLRFDSAAVCLICDMLYTIKFKNGNSNQYYVADLGWVNMMTEVVDDVEQLVESQTVKQYITEKMHEVWHYHGEIDYLVGTLKEAPAKPVEKATMITTSDSKYYTYTGGAWKEDTKFRAENFAIYHVRNASDTSYGIVKAGQAYYYFEGTWNNIDADTRDLENRVKKLEDEEKRLLFMQSEEEKLATVKVVDENYDYSELPATDRVICYVEEELSAYDSTAYTVHYKIGDGYAGPSDSSVAKGATAILPAAAPLRLGYTFVEWQNEAALGATFNFATPITKDYTLTAIWKANPVTVTYWAGDDVEGEVPSPVQSEYGAKVPLPETTLTREGYEFLGWGRNGILMTENDVLYGDTILEPVWGGARLKI